MRPLVVKRLEDVCLKVTDGTHQSPKFQNHGIPFLFVSNIKNNEIDYSTKQFISNAEYDILIKRTPVEIGDILLTTVGSYGNPAIVKSNKKFCFQRHIAYIKPNNALIEPYFLFGIFLSNYVKLQIENKVRGVAQKTLNLSDLKDISIIVPSFEDQLKYSSVIKNIEQQTLKVLKQQVCSENLFQTLLQKAFKGELVK